MAHLPEPVFRAVLEATPLVSIDLCLRRPDGRYLLGWRNNRPAARHWFVPGGRIRKNETIAAAFARLTEGELGCRFSLDQARLLGAFDHLYEDTVFGDTPYGTHYVVLAHRLDLPGDFEPRADDQHSDLAWRTPQEILVDPEVHANTKAYFPQVEQLG
ncbi:MAG: GDP-mannose mannosyl hydrolase [Verrucomicrobiota bacterium]